MTSNISGLLSSLIFILSFIAMMMVCVLSSAPCFELFSAAPVSQHHSSLHSHQGALLNDQSFSKEHRLFYPIPSYHSLVCYTAFMTQLSQHPTHSYPSIPHTAIPAFHTQLSEHSTHSYPSIPHTAIPAFHTQLSQHSTHSYPSIPHTAIPAFHTQLSQHSTHSYPSIPHTAIPAFHTQLSQHSSHYYLSNPHTLIPAFLTQQNYPNIHCMAIQ